jgi:hypothetical protein
MNEPAHPSQEYIEHRIEFHEHGARFYAHHGQTQLEAWSKKMAAEWRAKLEGRQPGDGE